MYSRASDAAWSVNLVVVMISAPPPYRPVPVEAVPGVRLVMGQALIVTWQGVPFWVGPIYGLHCSEPVLAL